MNVKRLMVFGMLGLFVISMMGGVLGDSHIDGEDLAEEFIEGTKATVGFFEKFFGVLLGPLFGDTELLSRVFFALLLGMIIYSIIGTIFSGAGKWTQWGITFVITSLSLLGMPSGFLEAIRIQYGAMGATILTVIPFIIVLIFSLKSKSVLIARVTWIFYAFYYFAMYTYAIITSKTGWFGLETAPYFVAFMMGLVLFFGMPLIRKLITEGELAGLEERGMSKVKRRNLLQQIQDEDLGRYAS